MSQRDTTLKLLVEAGATGVSSHVLVYEMGITRGAAVVYDLKGEGYVIDTHDDGTTPDGRQKLARYVLKGWVDPQHPSSPMVPVWELRTESAKPFTPPPDDPPPLPPGYQPGDGYAAFKALRDTMFGGEVESPAKREERVRKALG